MDSAMTMAEMERTIGALVAPSKGLLAADESTATIGKRFERLGIAATEENRRRYRQLLVTAPGIGDYISGVILSDETLRQRADDGRTFVEIVVANGIVPGIKVDRGSIPLAGAPGDRITEGLDDLRARAEEYRTLGACFAKWRAVIEIGDGKPSSYCLDANAHALARYAAICQEAGLVPIVEPEVLMDGAHSLERDAEVTATVLEYVFAALRGPRVVLEYLLLKPNMILPGIDCPQQATVREVAEATLNCLRRTVPAAVPGIVFLSGGQDALAATAHLNAMNAAPISPPWPLSFSFARALQEPALTIWRGNQDNVRRAQIAFLHRARCNSAARNGQYSAELEQLVDAPSGVSEI